MSRAVSDLFLTSAPVIEPLTICLPVITLPAAIAVPPIATNNANIATTIAGETCSDCVSFLPMPIPPKIR